MQTELELVQEYVKDVETFDETGNHLSVIKAMCRLMLESGNMVSSATYDRECDLGKLRVKLNFNGMR